MLGIKTRPRSAGNYFTFQLDPLICPIPLLTRVHSGLQETRVVGPALVCWGGVGGPTAQGLCRGGDGGPWEEAAGRGPPQLPRLPCTLESLWPCQMVISGKPGLGGAEPEQAEGPKQRLKSVLYPRRSDNPRPLQAFSAPLLSPHPSWPLGGHREEDSCGQSRATFHWLPLGCVSQPWVPPLEASLRPWAMLHTLDTQVKVL